MERRDLILASALPPSQRAFEMKELEPISGHIRRGIAFLTPCLQVLEISPVGEKRAASELKVLAHLNDRLVGTHVTDTEGVVKGKAFTFPSDQKGDFALSLPGTESLLTRAIGDVPTKNFDQERRQKLKGLGQRKMRMLYKSWAEHLSAELNLQLKEPLMLSLRTVRNFLKQHAESMQGIFDKTREILAEIKYLSEDRIPYLFAVRRMMIERLQLCYLIAQIPWDAPSGEIPKSPVESSTPTGKIVVDIAKRCQAEMKFLEEEIALRKSRLSELQKKLDSERKKFFTDPESEATSVTNFISMIEKEREMLQALATLVRETSEKVEDDFGRYQAAQSWNERLKRIQEQSESLQSMTPMDVSALFGNASLQNLDARATDRDSKMKSSVQGLASSNPEAFWRAFADLAKDDPAFLKRYAKDFRNVERLFAVSLFTTTL